MRQSQFSQEQIVMALRQAKAGTPVWEVCRKLGVSEATYYRWKKRYGSLGVSELRELRQLREENRKLKGLVADLSLDKSILQDALRSRIRELAGVRVRLGYRQIHVLLVREGWQVNHKRYTGSTGRRG